MSTPFKMNAGRAPFQKTGRGIPSSFCSSPVQQKRKDAISGEVIPEGAVFGETTSTPKNSAVTIHTRNWSTSGTEGTEPKSKPQMPDAEWRALVKKRKDEGLPPINPNPTPTGTTTPGTSGTRGKSGKQTWKTYHAEMIPMRPIQPITPKHETPKIIDPNGGLNEEDLIQGGGEWTGGGGTRLINKTTKAIKKGVENVGNQFQLSTGNNFKGGCLTD